MTHQQAIRILMLSPLYFRLNTRERKQLIQDYCRRFSEVAQDKTAQKSKR